MTDSSVTLVRADWPFTHSGRYPLLRLSLAVLHLLALGIGLGGIWARARWLTALAAPTGPESRPMSEALRRETRQAALVADNWWGMSAVVWIATGLWRLFSETEKSLEYYLANDFFRVKIALLVVIFLLELWPMITLLRWRFAMRRGATPAEEGATVRRLAVISYAQLACLLAMVTAAAAMARGFGA